MIALSTLNRMTRDAFRETLGGIFEHSPWVPERAWSQRPFETVESLHDALCRIVAIADDGEQLILIRAHPSLTGKLAIDTGLSAASHQEQTAAGLRQCSAEQLTRLHALNAAYEVRFGFPFILAVRGHTPASIIGQLEARSGGTPEAERREALRQIAQIARYRLDVCIDERPQRTNKIGTSE
jgi:OHCU decarboxylase